MELVHYIYQDITEVHFHIVASSNMLDSECRNTTEFVPVSLTLKIFCSFFFLFILISACTRTGFWFWKLKCVECTGSPWPRDPRHDIFLRVSDSGCMYFRAFWAGWFEKNIIFSRQSVTSWEDMTYIEVVGVTKLVTMLPTQKRVHFQVPV